MPSVCSRVTVFLFFKTNHIGIETSMERNVGGCSRHWSKQINRVKQTNMTAFARPSLLDNRYADIAETSVFTYDDDDLVNYADFLR